MLCFIPNLDFGSSPDTRSLEERLDDATEELDIGEFFGKPSRDRFDETTRYSLGMNTIQFDTSSLHETPQHRQEFVQGSVPTKRRRTTTPEEDDLLQARAMSELTISGMTTPKHATTAQRRCGQPTSESTIVNLEDLEDFSERKFRKSLQHFTTENVLRYFARLVQDRLEVFPVVAQPFIHDIAKVYETYLDIMKESDVAGRDSEVRQEMKTALGIFHKAL